MKMKMKDSKMMLAMFVVAALAFAGVAGAALAGENAQAKVPSEVPNLIVDKDTQDWYNITNAGAATVTFNSDAKYTGTISFGTGSGVNYAAGVTIEFTDFAPATGTITFSFNGTAPTSVIVYGETAGTMKVTKGTVVLGQNGANYFCGKLIGKTVTVTAENIFGFAVKAGETDFISGTVTDGSKTGATEGTAKIEGTAQIGGNFDITKATKVTVTIDKNATVTSDPMGSKLFDVYAANATNVTITLGNDAANDRAVAWLYEGNNRVADSGSVTSIVPATNKISLTTTKAIKPTVTYTLYIALFDNTASASNQYRMYAGEMTFTDTVGANLVTTASYTPLTVVSTGNPGGAVLGTQTTNDFVLNAGYTLLCGSKAATGGGSLEQIPATGKYTNASAAATNIVAAFIKKTADGTLYGYFGITDNGTTTNAAGNSVYTGTQSLDVGTGSCKFKFDDVTQTAPTVGLISTTNADSNLVIDGTLDVKYVPGHPTNLVTSGGNITVNGLFTYETESTTVPVSTNIDAAVYKTTSASTPKHTYYYTTLADAMTKASDITVCGKTVLIADTTLTGTAVAPAKNTFTVPAGSSIEVGRTKTATAAAATAVVTLPETSTLLLGAANGIKVVDGQFKYAKNTTANANITSDVFMKNDAFGIYTDIATALDIAVKDDVVKVRNDVAMTLSKSAEVKTDVKLDLTVMGTKNFTVGKDVVLTVSGELDYTSASGKFIIAEGGSVVLKSVKVKITALKTSGTLTFAKDFDNSSSPVSFNIAAIEIAATTAAKAAVFNVEGKYKCALVLTDGGSQDYTAFNVTGTFTAATGFALGNFTNMKLTVTDTGVFSYAVNLNVYDLTATDKAKIANNGAFTVTVAQTQDAAIKGKAVFGKPADSFTQSINGVEAKGLILSPNVASVTVYGKADNVTFTAAPTYATVFKIADSKKVWAIYQTVYGNVANTAMALPDELKITGHELQNWYGTPACSTPVSTAKIGEYQTLYSALPKLTYKVTFASVVGVEWLVDNVLVNNVGYGDMYLEYGAHTVKFRAVKGYDASNVKVTMNGQTYTSGQSFTLSDAANFAVEAGSEPTENPAKSEFGIVEIMLVIITIMVVIMAVIIALKLMRS